MAARGVVGAMLNLTTPATAAGPIAAVSVPIPSAGKYTYRQTFMVSAVAPKGLLLKGPSAEFAPDPDMRARRQPGNARRAASTSAITGAIAIAGASRSLRSAASVARRRAFSPAPHSPPC